MRRTFPAGLTLVGAGIALAFSPVGDKVAEAVLPGPSAKPGATQVTVPARVPPTTAEPAPAQAARPAAPTGPVLAADQQAAAADAVAHEASVAALAGGTSYRVVEAVPWTEGDASEIVGASLTLEFAAPVDATASLPGARFDAAGRTYQQLEYKVAVKQLTRVEVMVDFRGERRVVDVAPLDGAVEELPGNTHFKPRDGGGGA